MAEQPALVVSCEHAARRVPARYRASFAAHGPLLASHRGYDAGSLELARRLAARLNVPLYAGRWTRLLVDLNRSPGHPALFSELTRTLPRAERERIVGAYYRPYRAALAAALEAVIRRRRRVLHVSVHSFTPVLDGVTRRADIGLLYDPGRPAERLLAAAWCRALQARHGLHVRRNYPYRGTADGVTTWLRRHFPDPAYAGIELELNQRLLPLSRALGAAIAATLAEAMRPVQD